MSYIGNSSTTQTYVAAIDYFNGNGVTVDFTLSRPVATSAQVQVTIENVPQNPGTAFSIVGSTITFTSAPPAGSSNIYVYYTSPVTQVIAPSSGTVGTAQMANGVTVNFNDGSASAPSITNTDDTNTGMFFPAADTIAFAEGGTEQVRLTATGLLQFNSGYGSVATAYGCRAWVSVLNPNATIVGGSGNVTSFTRSAAGQYTVNFTTAMPDANYAVVLGYQTGAWGQTAIYTNLTTTSVGILTSINGATYQDATQLSVAIFR